MVLLWWCFAGGVVSSTGVVFLWWCFSGGVVVWWCFCACVFVVVVCVFEVFLCFCDGVFVCFFVKGRLSSHYREVTQRVLTTLV